MTSPIDVHSREGRALSVILMMLGIEGRAAIREHLLKRAEHDEYRHALNVMNDFERGYDQIKQAKAEGWI